ncbi:response regulator transcription factor [Flavobacterium sp. NRK F7]|uniref:response regulator transcription factor n=1 Tax=Flavobacterium sp. NRK F7 TaxID=2954930 RepID=UPI002090586A|nr:LuxR family transcriptional regulator [Flavobacterium sp. NRK F7]MCO6163928.1 LuxR C-terminal-related transcriptional regulator [Flavobacterium sp. NRK F7]
MNAIQRQLIIDIHKVADAIPGVVIINDVATRKVVYMSQKGLDNFEITLEELEKLGSTYYYKYFNEEEAGRNYLDYLQFIAKNDISQTLTYFQQVRKNNNEPWVWYLSVNKIILQENGLPSLVLTLAQPVSELTSVVNRLDKLMEEHLFLKESLHKFSLISEREKQVLKLLALGKTNDEIAKTLFISINTAKTHRKKIKEKLKAETTIELHKYASAFRLI